MNPYISFSVSEANETFPMSMSEYTSLVLNSHGDMRRGCASELHCSHILV
jgi:hypothetical protein